MGKRTRPRGRAARGTFDLFPTAVRSRAAHSRHGDGMSNAQGAEARRVPRRRYSGLAFCTPQSSDKTIGSKLWPGVRVVAAITARAVAFFAGAHVIVGEMMTPDARSEHGSCA